MTKHMWGQYNSAISGLSYTGHRPSVGPTGGAAVIHSRFEAIGAHLPTAVLATEELMGRLAEPPSFNFEAVTGVREPRARSTAPAAYEASFALATKAARDCLTRSRYTAAELDVVISVSITRSKDGSKIYFEPSFASMIAKELGATRAIH